MSLPLRHALENVSSLDRVLEDLLVRFIINCPPEDLSSVERELFHFEEASWFYTDFIKLMNQNLPTLKIKSLSQLIIKICPLIWKWDIKADEALAKFSKYKKTIPVRGAAIFNEDLNKILLVKGTESDSWSFPRGKISKDEDDVDCCIREVKEEIGFDLTDYIDEDQFIERNISAKNYKIYLIKNVPETFNFEPQVRNEIEKIKWFDFKTVTKNIYRSNHSFKYYLINSMIRPISMWVRHQKQVKNEDQLKEYAEEQLKLLLGITKEETIDPGRDLLNMLHSAVQSSEINNTSNQTQILPPSQPPIAKGEEEEQQQPMVAGPSTVMNPANIGHLPIMQQNPMIPFFPPPPQQQASTIRAMGFQPFAPFGFNNTNNNNTGFVPPQPFVGSMQGYMNVPPNDKLNTVPSTPNVHSLSKPSLISGDDHGSKPNELLSLLKNPKKSVSHLSLQSSPSPDPLEIKPKMRILQRGEGLSSKDESDSLLKMLHRNTVPPQTNDEFNETKSHNLLNLLKNPPTNNHEQTINDVIPENFVVNTFHSDHEDEGDEIFEDSSIEEDEPDSLTPSLTSQPTHKGHNVNYKPSEGLEVQSPDENDETDETEENYSNFEDSSDSENEMDEFKSAIENAPVESQSEIEGEQLEVLNENETPSRESIPDSILNENQFIQGEVPHQERKSDSVRSINSLSVNVSNTNIATLTNPGKPKFKILKRGEKLEDVSNSPLSPTQTQEPTFHEDVPSEAPLQEEEGVSPQPQGQDLLSILMNRSAPSPQVTSPNTLKTSLQKSEDTTNELMGLLKKNAEVIPESPEVSITISDPHELLATLKEPKKQYQENILPQTQPQYVKNDHFNESVFANNFSTQHKLSSSNGELLRMLQSHSNQNNQPNSNPTMIVSPNAQQSQLYSQMSPQSMPQQQLYSQISPQSMPQEQLYSQTSPQSMPPQQTQLYSQMNPPQQQMQQPTQLYSQIPQPQSVPQQNQQLYTNMSPQQVPQQLQSDSNSLLSMLKHPTHPTNQQQQPVSSNMDASSQLLNILHGK